MRTCKTCNEELDITMFSLVGGGRWRRNDCRDCHNTIKVRRRSTWTVIPRAKTASGKTRARQQVKYALHTGRMTREPCEVCGAERVHAHHDDYTRPLDVRWLCPTHHARIHNPPK